MDETFQSESSHSSAEFVRFDRQLPDSICGDSYWARERIRLLKCCESALSLLSDLQRFHSQGQVYGHLNLESASSIGSSHLLTLKTSPETILSSNSTHEIDLTSACFLAPEQSGVLKRAISPATDLYALGVFLYRSLTEAFPFPLHNLTSLLLAQTTASPPSTRKKNRLIPRELDQLTLKLLQREPSDRYQKTEGVRRDLMSILEKIRSSSAPWTGIGAAFGLHDVRSELAQPSFVGRERKWESFVQWMRSDCGEFQPPWLIAGAAGIGKSRLLQIFGEESSVEGVLTYRAYGSESTHTRPLESLLSFFRELDLLCAEDATYRQKLLERVESHSEALHSLLPALFSNAKSSSSAGPSTFAGRRLKQGVVALLDAMSACERRTLFLFDNLDHADDVSRSILIHWASNSRRHRRGNLLLVATATSPISTEFTGALGECVDVLEPLQEKELRELLGSMTGIFPDNVLQMIACNCGGNPGVAVAMIRGMVETGKAVFRDGKWHSRAVPLDIHQVGSQNQRSKLGRGQGLSQECERLLRAGAILGKTFRLDEATRLARLSLFQARSAMDTALNRQLVWGNANQNDFGFLHDEIHQAFLDELDPRFRKSLHLRAIRMIGTANEARCFELANHYDSAGYPGPAIRYSILAAQRSQEQFASELAIHYLTLARKWAIATENPELVRIEECLCEAYLATGDYDSAERSIRQALELGKSSIDLIRLTEKLGEVAFKKGRMSEAAEHFRQGLKLSGVGFPTRLPGLFTTLAHQIVVQLSHTMFGRGGPLPAASESQRMRWSLYSRLAHTYWFSRGAFWTLAAHLRGMNEAELYDDTPELAKSYSEHAPVCTLLRMFRRGEEYSKRSLAIRQRFSDLWGQGQTLFFAAVVPLAECRFQLCIDLANRAIAYLEPTGDAWETNMARYQKAAALMRIGRYRDAANEALRVHTSGVEIGDDQAAGISLDVLMRTAPSWVSEESIVHQASIERTDAQSHSQTRLGLAILRIHQGQFSEAIEVLEESLARCRQAGHLNTYISPSYAWRATAYRMLANSTPRENARLWSKRLRFAYRAARRATRIAKAFPADLPHSFRELGIVSLQLGYLRVATESFRKSLYWAQRLQCPMEEWSTLRTLKELADHQVILLPRNWQGLQQRFDELKSQLKDSIACLQSKEEHCETLSLADRFGMLLADGRRIVQSMDARTILREGCAAAQHLLRSQVSMVAMKEVESERWVLKRAFHAVSKSEASGIQSSDFERYLGEVYHQQSTLCFQWERIDSTVKGSLVGAPIRVRESIVGCLLVGHAEIKGHFGQDEMQLAEFLATLIGAALENSEGFAELQDLNRTLEQRVAERTAAAEQRAIQLNESLNALRQKEEELHSAIDEANRANQAKGQFLATMSHEIRTPLNGILGMASLAMSKNPDPLQQSFLAKIQSSGDSLLRLLNDLLDFSKIEAGKMTVEWIEVEPLKLIREVLDLFAISAFQKGIELVAYFDPNLPTYVLADATRLRQIILNLVGNAIKFTTSGSVQLRVERIESDLDREPRWVIKVIDSGIGIPLDKQEAIFEAFSQADNSTTRRFGGTGLGLAISNELTLLMDGQLSVESEVGKGSTFRIDLPLLLPSQGRPSKPRMRLPGTRFLVLDPCRETGRTVAELLESMGATALSLTEWSASQDDHQDHEDIDLDLFDVVIVGGPSANQWIEMARKSKVHLVFVQSPIESPLPGVVSITKPILPDDLARAVQDLGWAGSSQGLPELTFDENAVIESTHCKYLGPRKLRVLVAEDGEINQMVLVGILDHYGHDSLVANTGLEAVSLASRESFDLCLMDLDMPEMDGVEATKRIRAMQMQLPIYAMTAHHDPIHEKLCLDAGMNGYLTKPINQHQLEEILQRVMEHLNREGANLPKSAEAP